MSWAEWSSMAGTSGRGGAVTLLGLVKRYDDQAAVDGIDLAIESGEFFSLLGPSGCGKTTTLRMIAGFERPSGGQVLLDGADMSDVAPERRPVNTVFQSYALFPHLNVADNVAFGLRFTDCDKQTARRRVGEALALVRLTGFEKRKPGQLSGGQQQRVALARALVLRPRVLLLDEPLGALDAKLRKELQLELAQLQREVGITFIYVTHDQEEALTMSGRLAVMRAGRIAQCGTPREVYEEPANAYVADFLGVANVLPLDRVGATGLRLPPAPAGAVSAVIRPERVLVHDGPAPNGTLEEMIYQGATSQLRVRVSEAIVVHALVANDGRTLPARGDAVTVELPADAVRFLSE